MKAGFVDTLLHNLTDRTRSPILFEMDGRKAQEWSAQKISTSIAHLRGALRGEGVAPGDRVVVVASNSAWWVLLDVALLSEGAVTVPLYARQHPKELSSQIADANPTLVVATQTLVETLTDALRAHGIQVPVRAVSELRVASVTPLFEPAHPRPPEDVVSILYTSGTSGTSKGVMLNRGNCDFMLSVTQEGLTRLLSRQTSENRVFHYLPFCFAGSRILLWTCLTKQIPLFLSTNLDNLRDELAGARPHVMLNVPFLLERIRRGVEEKLLNRSPWLHKGFLAALEAYHRRDRGDQGIGDRLLLACARRTLLDRIRKQIGRDLEALLCGSAPLSRETQLWFQFVGIPVYQIYGLTETTAIVTMDQPESVEPGYVGTPIRGIETKINDQGELWVRGPNVLPGYYNNESATQEVMDGDWFNTGDRVEKGPGGRLKILGRSKNILVSSSGHNVAPEPLEATLRGALPKADHIVVVGHARPFLSVIVSGNCTENELCQAVAELNGTLPHYKRIRGHHLTTEPFTADNDLLTANQKLRRSAIEHHFENALSEIYSTAATPPDASTSKGSPRARRPLA